MNLSFFERIAKNYMTGGRLGFAGLVFIGLLSLNTFSASTNVFAEDNDAPVTIRIQGLPNPGDRDIVAQVGRVILRQFQAEHPNISLMPFVMPEVGGISTIDQGPLMAIAAGIPPHVIYVNFRMSSTYLEQGFLAPMEMLLARLQSDNPNVRDTHPDGSWKADPTPEDIEAAVQAIRARVPERVWPVIYRQGFHNGPDAPSHVWSMNTSTLVGALFYRRDLFMEAGLDPERPPRDWSELLEYARLLRVPEKRQFGMYFGFGHTISYSMYNFFVANGARAVEQLESGEWEAAYDSREAAEAIHFFWRLVREPFERNGVMIDAAAGMDPTRGRLLWERGQVAMQFGYLDDELLANISPQLVGIAPPPVSARGTRGSELNAAMLGVFAGASPEQQLAAMRYIWHRTGPEAQAIFVQTMVENGYGRFVNPNLLSAFGYERVLQQVPREWVEAFNLAIEHGVPEPYGRNTQNIYRWLSEPVNRAIHADLSSLDAEEAIALIQRWSQDSAEEFNVKVLGRIPPDIMLKRRIAGGAILLALFLFFSASMKRVWGHFSDAALGSIGGGIHTRKWGYLLILPAILLVIGWMYLPLLFGGISMAFMDYRIILDSTFVGVDNFAQALFNERFWSGLARTFFFVLLTIGLGFWPPILLAILLQEIPTNTAKYIYRTIFYLPAVLSGLVVMFLWRQLYDPSSEGVLNQVLLSLNQLGPVPATLLKLVLAGCWLSFIAVLIYLPIRVDEMTRTFKAILWSAAAGAFWLLVHPLFTKGLSAASGLVGSFSIEPLGWLTDPSLAMICIVVPHVWAASGPGCILYLAALKSIPEDLYEAADIDGASIWHKVCYIVLPRLKYLIVIQFIAAVIGGFKGGAEMILVMTGGGPMGATSILSLEIFYTTFMDLNYGLGTAMAWMLGALLIGFTAYQMKLLSNAEFRTTDIANK